MHWRSAATATWLQSGRLQAWFTCTAKLMETGPECAGQKQCKELAPLAVISSSSIIASLISFTTVVDVVSQRLCVSIISAVGCAFQLKCSSGVLAFQAHAPRSQLGS